MFSCDLAHVVQAHVDKGASYRGTSWVEKVHVGEVQVGERCMLGRLMLRRHYYLGKDVVTVYGIGHFRVRRVRALKTTTNNCLDVHFSLAHSGRYRMSSLVD